MELDTGGRRAFAATFGSAPDAERGTVAFVHGAAMDRTVWTMFGRYFSRHGYHVLALDLPGHGRSDGPALASIPDMADWLVSALDAAGVAGPAWLVGHSMGSLVALEAGARHPERVAGLVLIGTSAPMPVTDALLDPAAANEHVALDRLTLWGHSALAHVGGFSVPGMWMTGGGLRLVERAAPGVLHADLSACNDYVTGLDSAREVRCPTLLVLGERDAMTPARAANGLEEALPDARRAVIPRAGHQLMTERPNEVLDALAAFID